MGDAPCSVGDRFRHKLTGEVVVVSAVSPYGKGHTIHYNDDKLHAPYAYRASWSEFKRYREEVRRG